MTRRGALFTLLAACLSLAQCRSHWVDIWGTMPQLVEPANLPNPPYNGTGVVFANATLRQTIWLTQSASTIRLELSNAFGPTDLPITAVTTGVPANGSVGTSAVDPSSLRRVTFSGGQSSFTIPRGAQAVSDPLAFPVAARTALTISVYLAAGQAGNSITGHPGSRTTSYMVAGNLTGAVDVGGDASVQTVDHWYFISAVQGWLPGSHASLVLVGDSITDGRGSTTNHNNRWPDQLLDRMQAADHSTGARQVAVINEAAGGNRVLYDGLGPNALSRIGRDVIERPGAAYALVFEGVNDIGTCATDAAAQESMGTRLIAAFDQMITRFHAAGLAVFGCTITPFSGPGQTYSDANREVQRQRINAWIRTSGRYDAVVDFDAVVRDPANHTQLADQYNSGDYLHPNPAGYKAMAAAVDLGLFAKFADGVHSMV